MFCSLAAAEGYQPSGDFGDHTRGGMLVAYLKICTDQPGGSLFGKVLDPIHYSTSRDFDDFDCEYPSIPQAIGDWK